jgi:hypothetical protein
VVTSFSKTKENTTGEYFGVFGFSLPSISQTQFLVRCGGVGGRNDDDDDYGVNMGEAEGDGEHEDGSAADRPSSRRGRPFILLAS